MKVIDVDGKELTEYDFLSHKLKLWEKIYYPCYRFFNKIICFPRKVKWFIQRGRRGYSDCDAWGIDFYLVDIIPKMIKQLKKYQAGVPTCMYVNTTIDNQYAWTDEEDEVAQKRWDKVLDDILASFPLMERELGVKTLTKEEIKIRNKGVKQLYKYFYNLWY